MLKCAFAMRRSLMHARVQRRPLANNGDRMAIDQLPPHTPADPGAYLPPVDEYAFLLSQAFGSDIVAGSTDGAMTAEDALDAISAGGEFAVEVFAPLDRVGDTNGAKLVDGKVVLADGFAEAYKTFREAGWTSASIEEEAGGDGLPTSVTAALSEFWNAANMGFALCPGLTRGAIRALNTHGSQELKDTYLPKMVTGEWTGTMNLTEPQAGSDLAAVTTMARDNGDGSYSISGQKIFITWGDHEISDNIIHLVLARTENAPEGHRGISLFVVPKYLLDENGKPGERNKVWTVGVEHKLGIHASPTCVLQYEGAKGYLVGELHNGLTGMFVMMNEARYGMGIQGLGVAQRAYQRALDYAYTRLQGAVMGLPAGTPIAGHPDVRRMLLSMSSEISALRAFAIYTANLHDHVDEGNNSQLFDFFTPIFKSWGSEVAVSVASEAIQVHGGMGFIEETGAAQQYRDARIIPIYEGTTAIQSNDLVGRKVLRDRGETAQLALGEILAQIEKLQSFDNPVAARVAERLQRAVESASNATTALFANAENPRDVFAVSVPYQRLLSTLLGGFMHAIITTAVLEDGTDSADNARRLTEADFYTAHHLANAHALAETVAAGEIA